MAPDFEKTKRGFSEETLREAVAKELHPQATAPSYKPYKEAIDYLLAEQNQSIQTYQKAYGFANEDIAYQQFYATHQDVVHAQNEAMNQEIQESFAAPSQPQYSDQGTYVQQLEEQNAQLQEQVANEEQELEEVQQEEELLEVQEQALEKLQETYKKKDKKLLQGPPRWHMLVIWMVFAGMYVVDLLVGATPVVGDILSTLIAVVAWFIVGSIIGFGIFRYAIQLMFLDLVVSVVSDAVLGTATLGAGLIVTAILDALVEPYMYFRKKTPQQLYKAHYFDGMPEAKRK